MDYIIRATAANHEIRAFMATTKEMVEEARVRHNTSPVATAAIGRLLTASAMMGTMMKGEEDLLTLQIIGDGEIKSITATADSKGNVKGYVGNPNVLIPANSKGKLDVSGAIGNGQLRVISDLGLKEAYTGQINLISGEIAEDLTYYYAASEQIPSSVALGVLMNKDNTVRRAGGFIIQLMPFATEETISKLEDKINSIESITSLLDKEMSPEDILKVILGDLDLEIMEKVATKYYCNCSKSRVWKALISIGEKEIVNLIKENEDIEVNCHFCNTNYNFNVEELKDMLKMCKKVN